MKARLTVALLVALVLVTSANHLHGQKIKMIVDQDARGPATTDMQSILIFLQSDRFDVLGITTVSGDQWVKEEIERWEALYGKFRYKGCWSDFSDRPASTPPAFRAGYHEPDVIPPLVEGSPHTKPLDETAAHFIVRMVHKYPGEVVVWAGGPLTNIALALRLDPQVATLAKELVLMGSGMYADNGGISGVNGRREFNWWFDPEAVRITMRAPWKKITITPIDISVKTKLGPEIRAAIAKADTPVARYLTEYSVDSFMWDELSAAAMVDPSIITGEKELYVDIDIDHGPSYGETLFWNPGTALPAYERKATVQFDVDAPKLYDLYVKLMTQPARKAPWLSD